MNSLDNRPVVADGNTHEDPCGGWSPQPDFKAVGAMTRPGDRTMGEFVPCPSCSQTNARKVSFTWWGGLLGPSLFTHVKCPDCGATYNGKTGKSNTVPITIYIVVSVIIGTVAMVLLWRL
jgi:hypothetical protein